MALGPNTVAERIVTELERRGLARFGPQFADAQAVVAGILTEWMNTPTVAEFVAAAHAQNVKADGGKLSEGKQQP